MKYAGLIMMLLCALYLPAQEPNKSILAGNDSYRQGNYDKAGQEYEEAIKADPANTTARYNLANSEYRRGRGADAIKKYDEITRDDKDAGLRAKAFYNKGAILSREKKLEESIEAYKNALRQDPGDKEARENLQKALLELKKNQPPPPEKKEDEKKKQQQQQQQKQQQRPRMNQKEMEQRLKLLEQKEKEVQQRLQKEKSKSGGSQPKDW